MNTARKISALLIVVIMLILPGLGGVLNVISATSIMEEDCDVTTEITENHVYDNDCDAECNECGFTRQVEHNYVWDELLPATCGRDGYKQEECTVCHDIRNENTIIKATGKHRLGQWFVYIPPTFNEEGLELRLCYDCDYGETLPIPKNGEGHICEFAGEVEIVSEASCTEDGIKKVYCIEPQCEMYETVIIDSKGHTPGEWIVVNAPSCTNEGSKERRCTVCKELLNTEAITPNGHRLGDWYVSIEATFHTDGEERKDCFACDYYELKRIPKFSESHICDFSGKSEIVSEASCTEDGIKKIYCIEPQCNMYETVIIDSKGHTEGEWMIATPATCDESGVMEKKCVVCSEVVSTEVIPFAGHQYSDWIMIKAPTATETGEILRECAVCHYTQVEIVEPMKPTSVLGDANGDGVVTVKDATIIQKYLASLVVFTDRELSVADVDDSGTVNIKDATVIQKHIAGIDIGFLSNL